MLKRLLDLFSKKQSSQKTFEEKLEKLGSSKRSDRSRFARDQQTPRVLNSRYQTQPFRGNLDMPNRGMSRSASVERRMQQDDMMLHTMMAMSVLDVPTQLTETHHTPSHGGYDTSPSDCGGSYDSGGGGSCD